MTTPFFSSDDPRFEEHDPGYRELYCYNNVQSILNHIPSGLVYTQSYERLPEGYLAVQFAPETAIEPLLVFRVLKCRSAPMGMWSIVHEWKTATPEEDAHYIKCLQFMDFPTIVPYGPIWENAFDTVFLSDVFNVPLPLSGDETE